MLEDIFGTELETFRREEEQGQQFFFSYLTIRTYAHDDPALLKALNRAPLFWKTVDYALLKATFIALGRIFDREGRHNINVLFRIARKNLQVFNREALADRKRQFGLSEKQIASYVNDAYVPSSNDFDELEAEIEPYRNAYNPRYKDVRDKIFAHNVYSGIEEVNLLLEKTDIEELKRIFGFLRGVHAALHQLYVNGVRPAIVVRSFERPLRSKPSKMHGHDPADILSREIAAFFDQVAPAIR
jgi:hypothetical protein